MAIGLILEQQPRAPAAKQPVGHVERLGAARGDPLRAAAEQQDEQADEEENLSNRRNSLLARRGALQVRAAADTRRQLLRPREAAGQDRYRKIVVEGNSVAGRYDNGGRS